MNLQIILVRKMFDIIDIKSKIEDFGCDSLVVFGGKFEGGIFLQQISDEFANCILDILSLIRKSLSNYLEIGCATGGSTFTFNYFFKFDNIALIDDNRHKRAALRKQILKGIKYSEFIGDSHSIEAFKFVNNLRLRFDIMFIDGDHSYDGVKLDVQTYLPFLSRNGFLILHDTVACAGVKKMFEEVKQYHNLKLVGEYISKSHKPPLGIGLFQSWR